MGPQGTPGHSPGKKVGAFTESEGNRAPPPKSKIPGLANLFVGFPPLGTPLNDPGRLAGGFWSM